MESTSIIKLVLYFSGSAEPLSSAVAKAVATAADLREANELIAEPEDYTDAQIREYGLHLKHLEEVLGLGWEK